jgi:hypothetical protein
VKTNELFRYLLAMLGGALAGALAFAALVLLVDAVWLFGAPELKGFNALKTKFVNYTREMKPLLLERAQPEVLILGASTAENGYAPDFRGFGGRPGFNLALGSASIYEIYRMFQHALHEAPIKTVVFTADFATYTVNESKRVYGFREGLLAVQEDGTPTPANRRETPWRLLFRPSYYADTVSTLRQQNPDFCDTVTPVYASHLYRRNGQRMPESGRRYVTCLGNDFVFSTSVKTLATRFAGLDRRNLFPAMDDGTSKWEMLRRVLRLAHSSNVAFRVNFPPCHADYLELIERVLGPSALYDFKKRVVEINLEVAREMKRKPFPVWDFCTYNRFTTPRVIDNLQRGQTVRGFMDLQHFDPDLGSRALGVMLGTGSSSGADSGDFGVPIAGPDDLARLAQRQATRKLAYEAANPDEIMWLVSRITAAMSKAHATGFDLGR